MKQKNGVTQNPHETNSQHISEVDEPANWLAKTNLKPKSRKWKFNARAQAKEVISMGPITTKRPNNTISGQSLQSKQAKLNSPSKALNNKLQINAPAMKIQLAWQQHNAITLEDLEIIPEDISAEVAK